MSEKKSEVTLIEALIPIVFLIVFLAVNVSIFGDSSLDGSNQIVLILSGALAAWIAFRKGTSWSDLLNGITSSINAALPSILILLMIGAVAGSWLISGVVPAMIYYGLLILNPTIFLFAACVVCAIVSLATGSSWTTAMTVGVALLGIGQTLGIHDGMVLGAIISGAYFGDKMSPLSDTTNLAPAVAGTDLFTHIRYMTITTFPSMGITLVIFLIMGFVVSNGGAVDTGEVLVAISSKFNINIALLLVPAAVIVLILKKVPALPSLLVGALLAVVFALIFQPNIVREVSGAEGSVFLTSYIGTMKALFGAVSVTTTHDLVNELLSSGGMYGMLKTVWLIISAMVFGGVMEGAGFLQKIVEVLMKRVETTGSLIATTCLTCMGFNVAASDQYLAIVVPGRMFAAAFQEKNLAPENLSRTLEDSGTVTSVLVPWNTCGAFHSGLFGIGVGTFAPYCFFNILSPIMTITFGYLNIRIKSLTERKKED